MNRILRDGRLVTTAAVCRRGNLFFLARRKPGGSESLRWEFPGGKCDADVREQVCLVREFEEEFGVTIEVQEELGSVPFEHGGTAYILVGYRAHMPEDARLELREHVDSGWFAPDVITRMDLSGSDRVLLEQILAAASE